MQQIGKYTIVGQIGTGGFGVVYEGHDPFLKRRVAIKTCSSEEPDIRDRFFREAEIAGNLRHRNIVTVHDFGIQDGIPYLVQEYLSGEDLDRLVARREPLPPTRRLDILLQAAQGLEYAHSRGVIHRDVKPGNLRLTTEGVVKIMDFGIAKLANVASHLTRTGMTVGTAAYLPPEQIRGTAVDHRADIFSFGVTAYELLGYRRPFSGKTISALFWELLQKPPEPLARHWPQCPPRLEALVARCLAKDPAERYPDFAPLIAELRAAMAEVARDDVPTASHATSGRPPAPGPAMPRPGKGAAAAGRRATPAIRPRETSGLLGDVQEALTTARTAAGSRRVRELLAEGDVAAAERELEALPETPGGEVEALRRQVARARCDQLLVDAAAAWGQGDPTRALATVDELLALAPDHPDGLRLRAAWRTEHEARERQRRETAAAAEALRRQAAASPAAAQRLLDKSTVGIDAARMAIARERAAAEAARLGAGRRGSGTPAAPGRPAAAPPPPRPPAAAAGPQAGWAPPAATPAVQAPAPSPEAAAPAAGLWAFAASPGFRIAVVLGALLLLALLALGLWWVIELVSALSPAAPGPVGDATLPPLGDREAAVLSFSALGATRARAAFV